MIGLRHARLGSEKENMMVDLNLDTATVDLASEASVRGISVGAEWQIAISVSDLYLAASLLLDAVEESGRSADEETIEILPHPEFGDGVIMRLRGDEPLSLGIDPW